MAMKPVSDAVLKQALKLNYKYEGNQTHAAQAAGLAIGSTFTKRLVKAQKKFPDLAKQYAVKPKTIVEHAVEHRDRANAASSAAKLKDALREISNLQERIQQLEYADNVSLKPADWTLDTRVPKNKSPHIPLLFFSDAQAGEIVRSDETDAPWDYDSKIFRQRYRKMISTTVDLATNHGGTRWSYPGAVYLRGGDNVSGGLHEDLRELGEDCTVIQQCELVVEEEVRGIQILADVFGKVEVHTPGAAGNHDRITHKPPTKLAWARSLDRLIHKMLTGEFKNDKRVTFHISHSPDIRFPIYDKRMLLSHGDKIGSRGGMGFVGPGATILRGWQKVILEQAALGYIVDMMFTGHFHYPMDLLIGTANGSFTGTTEFGKMFRMAVTPPLQYLHFFHPKFGAVDTRKLYLA